MTDHPAATVGLGAELAGVAVILASADAAAERAAVSARYLCARGVEVPVVYFTDGDGGSVAVLTVEGRQIVLWPEPAASGVRYGWPSDGSNYVWWSRGQHEAVLLWHDGATGTDTVILDNCLSH